MTPHELPLWAQYVQALGLPAFAGALTWFGIRVAREQAKIAARQERIARERLRHDLYDRRYAIFMAFHRMIFACLRLSESPEEAMLAASLAASQAPFILDEALGRHLEQLHTLAFRYHMTKSLFSPGSDTPDRVELAKSQMDDSRALLAAIPALSEAFEPFLKLDDLTPRAA